MSSTNQVSSKDSALCISKDATYIKPDPTSLHHFERLVYLILHGVLVLCDYRRDIGIAREQHAAKLGFKVNYPLIRNADIERTGFLDEVQHFNRVLVAQSLLLNQYLEVGFDYARLGFVGQRVKQQTYIIRLGVRHRYREYTALMYRCRAIVFLLLV